MLKAIKKKQDYPETRELIEETHNRNKELANGLSDRIERYEKWLGQLPGRIEVTHWTRHPDSDAEQVDYVFGLKLCRVNKEWVIWHASERMEDDSPPDWKPLKDAPIRLRAFGIKCFPELLVAIRTKQEELEAAIESTFTEFDSFFAQLNVPGKERP